MSPQTYEPDGVKVSNHALARWRERVDPEASEAQAETEILAMLEAGTATETPPRWSKFVVKGGDQVKFVHWLRRAGVVLVASRDGSAVVTVLSERAK